LLDTARLREDFPIFSRSGKPLVYLDNAATTQKPTLVLQAVNRYYESYNANIHRALYEIGEKATTQYENTREQVRKFLNVPPSHSIIFTRGTTESINLIAYAWARKALKPGNEIVITEMEHHSNLVPWQLAARDTGATLKYIPLTSEAQLDLTGLDAMITHKTKLVSVVHQSNVFSNRTPLEAILDRARSVGAVTCVDGAQSVPHFPIDLIDLETDFYAFSGHKMLGPTGVGVLIGRTELLDAMDPFLAGGEMIDAVTMDHSTWNEVPWKFEAGTPNIAQVIGLGAAIDYLESIGMEAIQNHDRQLTRYALEKLSAIKNIQLFGQEDAHGPVILFNVEGIHPFDLAKFLDQDGICIRAGHHCVQPAINKLGLTAAARASFYLYNTEEDINKLCTSIEKTALLFR
jgi:cysteine desulfurase/selenocysteine lyase